MVLQLTALHIATLVAAAMLLIAAALSDARHYRIPNTICVAVLALFPVYAYTAPHGIDWRQHLMVSGLVLLSGFAMFMGNLAGAGDVKLLAVVSLWAGPHLIAVLIITTALAGGLLALAIAGITHQRNKGNSQAVSLAKVPIPYGIAIAFGGICTFCMIFRSFFFLS